VGLAIAYNQVRFEAERVGTEGRVPPTRASFVAARRDRNCPRAARARAVKIKMSNYPRKRPAKSSSRSRAK
jgi:hypothetical protein